VPDLSGRALVEGTVLTWVWCAVSCVWSLVLTSAAGHSVQLLGNYTEHEFTFLPADSSHQAQAISAVLSVSCLKLLPSLFNLYMKGWRRGSVVEHLPNV
jgi:hypothetical protein